MSGTKKILVAEAPDGQVIRVETSGGWDLAGIVKRASDGSWVIVQRGCSHEAVAKRTKTSYYRGPYTDFKVVQLREQMPSAIERYLSVRHGSASETHVGRLRIEQVFLPGLGWRYASDKDMAAYPSRTYIRQLARTGEVAAISVGWGHACADFQMTELVTPRGTVK